MRLGDHDNDARFLLLSVLGVAPLPPEGRMLLDGKRRWRDPPFSTRPFWRHEKLIRSYPVDERFVAKLLPIFAHARFELLERRMSWAQVESDGRRGWVLFFFLMAGEPPKPAGGTAVAEAWTLGTQRPSQGGGVTATIGVRGIDEEQLRAARFNAEELKRLEHYAMPRQVGEGFAAEAGLAPRDVAYLKP